MTKDKLLSEKELGYKVSAENWRESYFKLMDKQAEAVKKLKSALLTKGRRINRRIVKEEIDKIMGNFNHSPQDISESPSTEDTHVQDKRPKVKVPNDKLYDELYGDNHSPQDERARSRKVDSTSKNVRYNASKPISNKRGGSFEDAHVQKDKGCGGKIC